MKEILLNLFLQLNSWIEAENTDREEAGVRKISRCKITLLGQMSLIVDDQVSAALALAQTADMDAKLQMDFPVKKKLKELLSAQGLIYDEDSDKIFIPKNSRELEFCELSNIIVKRLDPESTLVSKAVKAVSKNKQLLRQALTKNIFPHLFERIVANEGDPKQILSGDTNE